MRPRMNSMLPLMTLITLLAGTGGGAARSATLPPASPWPKALGGADRESATGIAVDQDSNSYVAGTFEGQPAFDAVHLKSAGQTDVFVARLDPDAHVVWAVAVGGPGADEGRGIAVSPAGDVYVTGFFSGTVDFDPGPGRTELTSAGSSDAFLLRLNPRGELVWARRLGGKLGDVGLRVAVGADAVWVTGYFQGAIDLPATAPPSAAAAPRLESAGGTDAFVAKLDLDGRLLWAQRIGGARDDQGRGVAAGRSGEVWVAGNFEAAPTLGPEGGSLDFQSAGRSDVFLLRLDAAGRLLWSGRIGGEGADACEGIAATPAGGAAVVGEFTGTADLDPGPGVQSLASHGSTDAFVLRVDFSGRLLWVHQFGEEGADLGTAVSADRLDSVYATGFLQRRGAGDSLAWVAEYSSSGERTWSVGLQATGGLQALAIAADSNGLTQVAGSFRGETKELRETAAPRIKAAGGTDAFVWRLVPAPTRRIR